ncbi:PhzF family phenazine biosynthesis protein [Bacillus sp. JJ722]|uniref:PhzF family phenazine biosynthesis protein n=1 Tax=Bacillus sp. JJ722 TaxID=3122973 RepID=UPI002FFE5E87
MKSIQFYILDVFAETKYAGNQLAVFTDCDSLSTTQMQKIAREINFSETSFIFNKQESPAYPARIFTPNSEIPFAGHPTLGTAYIIQQELEDNLIDSITLDLQVGTIPVVFKQNEAWMSQNPPTFGQCFEPNVLAEVLNISEEDIDTNYPIQEVSTGFPAIIIPIKSLQSVQKCRINQEKYAAFIENVKANILVFTPETVHKENNLHVRVFCDYFGFPEDPATGSGSGNLASYLLEHNYLDSQYINLSIEQGYEMNRPSKLLIKASKNLEQFSIEVGGNIQLVAKGEWFV